jgi:Family of unknown function (DUF6346)
VRPPDDRTAKLLAKLEAELAAHEQEVDRQRRQREREAAERAARDRDASPLRRLAERVWSFLFVLGIVVLAAGLGGLAITLSRMSPHDMADARREGQATVGSCERHGPITNRGFGYWEGCDVRVVWSDGEVEDEFVEEVFRSADIGTPVRVGDMGRHRTERVFARPDAPPRPWLDWLSYAVAAVAFVPTFVAVLILKELLSFRRKK